jgi:hypothetical protein
LTFIIPGDIFVSIASRMASIHTEAQTRTLSCNAPAEISSMAHNSPIEAIPAMPDMTEC